MRHGICEALALSAVREMLCNATTALLPGKSYA